MLKGRDSDFVKIHQVLYNRFDKDREQMSQNSFKSSWIDLTSLILWNVIVAFIVNILAGIVSEKISNKNKQTQEDSAPVEDDELLNVLKYQEIIVEQKQLVNEDDSKRIIVKSLKLISNNKSKIEVNKKEQLNLFKTLLEFHNWPGSDIEEDSSEILSHLITLLNSLDND